MGWRSTLGVVVGGCVLELGCLLVWALSPRLTAAYDPDYIAAFFARLPAAATLVDTIVAWSGPLQTLPETPLGMAIGLDTGLLIMSAGYLLGLVALGRRSLQRARSERPVPVDVAAAATAAVAGPPAGRVRQPAPVVCAAPPEPEEVRHLVWLVVGFAAVFRVTMACLPGLFSTDIFSYVMYGRIAAVYADNPYVQPPSAFGSDAFLGWVFWFWRDQPSVYGPLWTDASWLLSSLSADLSNFDQVQVYRLSLIGLEAATLGLLWWLLDWLRPDGGSPAARLTAFTVFAWNPLVVFDLVGNTHNDVLMLALLALGLAGIARAGALAGTAVLTLSGLVKFSSGLVALFWSIASCARSTLGWRRRSLRLLGAWALAAALVALLGWPWLRTPRALAALGDAAGGRLVLNSAPDLLALFLADQLLVPAGFDPDLAEADARFWTRLIARLVFVAYLTWEAVRLWRTARADPDTRQTLRHALEAGTRSLLILPLLVFTWVWSWYFSWPLLTATLLGAGGRLTRLVVAYTLLALLVVAAHLFLSQDLSGGFVLLMAFAPLVVLVLPRPAGRT